MTGEAFCVYVEKVLVPTLSPGNTVIIDNLASHKVAGVTAIMAKASITMETRRYQPWQDLLSLWSSPNSFLAVSKLSSIAHRWPSTSTSVSLDVAVGTRWRRRRDRHRRYDDGSADLVSKGPDLRRLILRPDRPIRGSTNHASVVLWLWPLLTGVSSRTRAASGRSRQPCRRLIDACPRIEIHARC